MDFIYGVQFWRIQASNEVTRAKPAGCPCSQPAAAPNEVTPIRTRAPPTLTVNGPPLVTDLNVAEVADDPSLVRPHPEAVA